VGANNAAQPDTQSAQDRPASFMHVHAKIPEIYLAHTCHLEDMRARDPRPCMPLLFAASRATLIANQHSLSRPTLNLRMQCDM
jgi:hypothetical protein